MSDPAQERPTPDAAFEENDSTEPGQVPTNRVMAALHHVGTDASVARRRSWLLGLASPERGTPEGVPDTITLADELEDLRERLAAAERRAREAEMALPHLLGLGQRTVNGLLSEARDRARQIVETAKADADAELDALRMAVAAEAMGLEQIRSELQRRIKVSASEMSALADHPMLLGEPIQLDQPGLEAVPAPTAAPAPRSLPAPRIEAAEATIPADAGIGIVEASVMEATAVEAQVRHADPADATDERVDDVDLDLSESASTSATEAPTPAAAAAGAEAPADGASVDTDEPARHRPNPSPGFADAWDLEEEDGAAEAFERFFSAELGTEPSREWILADDSTP